MTRILTAALLAALAAGCGPSDSPSKEPGPAPAGGGGAAAGGVVKIGVAGPKTGGQAKNGEDLINGTTLAVEEWNAKGGVLGKRIEVVFRDDEAEPKNAPAVAQELVNAGVTGVVGHFNSGCTIPASEIYQRAGIASITPASTNTFVTERNLPSVFRICGRDDMQGKAAADFIVDVLKAKKVAVFDDKTPYGKGLADYVAKYLEGRTQVVVREGFDKSERNFRPYLGKLIDSGAEVWYFGGIYEQAAPLLLQAGQLGVKAPMMSGDGVHGYQADFIDKVGAGADGTLTTFPDLTSAPAYPGFLKNYKERFKVEPGPYAIYSYAAATCLLEGVRASNSTEGTKVAEAMHKGSYETLVGKVELDARGDVKVNAYRVWVVKGGKHVLHGSK